MRKVLLLIIIGSVFHGCKTMKDVVPISITSEKEIVFDTLNIRENYQLNYNLASGGERYQFIVDIYKMQPTLDFKFTMTNSHKTSGMITISSKAIQSATCQKNGFGNYDDNLEDNEITVFISKKVFSNLIKKGKATFDGDFKWGSAPSTYLLEGNESYNYELNGVTQTVEVLHLVQDVDENAFEFWILNNPNQPLILKMNVGWEISLKEINHNYDD